VGRALERLAATEADLFLLGHQQRRRSCAAGQDFDLVEAIRDAARRPPSRRVRRERERNAPLPLAS